MQEGVKSTKASVVSEGAITMTEEGSPRKGLNKEAWKIGWTRDLSGRLSAYAIEPKPKNKKRGK
ncbi:UNVERIFIED_CONTAM: hypothetical protein Sradi_6420900 [Sesamum radiatum]|uniref:Uncharacterized protein n=1 Tax=Sesamum radiatum TaxID=300843 RepID=A0AAW2K3X7_SESRA